MPSFSNSEETFLLNPAGSSLIPYECRRSTPRACQLGAACWPVDSKAPERRFQVIVIRLSAGNAILHSSRPFESGLSILIEFRALPSPVRSARVVRSRPDTDGESWLIDCAFTECLTDEELRAFLSDG